MIRFSIVLIGLSIGVLLGSVIFINKVNNIQSSPVAASRTLDDIDCIAQNVYHEARGETLEGQVAVAMVTINRFMSEIPPFGRYKNVCDVVYDGGYGRSANKTCQFAWTCDNISDDIPNFPEYKEYIMKNVIGNLDLLDDFDCVLYYHAADGRYRGWVSRGKLTNPVKVDNHLFYKDPSCK